MTFLEIGAVSLARRIGPRVGRWISRVGERLGGARHRDAYRIPWSKVRDVGIDIEVDVAAADTPILDWQIWLRDHVIRRIPGS